MRVFRFIFTAWLWRHAYIDLDGCLLHRYRCPPELKLRGIQALMWWRENLQPTPIVIRRLLLLYVLRALGVRLVIWTNRCRVLHEQVTRDALGRHVWLFHAMEFYDGEKILSRPLGPVMDDQKAYLKCGVGFNLLVEQL